MRGVTVGPAVASLFATRQLHFTGQALAGASWGMSPVVAGGLPATPRPPWRRWGIPTGVAVYCPSIRLTGGSVVAPCGESNPATWAFQADRREEPPRAFRCWARPLAEQQRRTCARMRPGSPLWSSQRRRDRRQVPVLVVETGACSGAARNRSATVLRRGAGPGVRVPAAQAPQVPPGTAPRQRQYASPNDGGRRSATRRDVAIGTVYRGSLSSFYGLSG